MKSHWLPWNKETKYWPWKTSFAFKAIKKFQGNILIIKHENDGIIPENIIQEYYKSAEKEQINKLALLIGATHKTSDSPIFNKNFIDLVKNFILKRKY